RQAVAIAADGAVERGRAGGDGRVIAQRHGIAVSLRAGGAYYTAVDCRRASAVGRQAGKRRAAANCRSKRCQARAVSYKSKAAVDRARKGDGACAGADRQIAAQRGGATEQ